MEMLREAAPFLIGVILPPMVMLAVRANWSGGRKFAAAFAPALLLGVCTSVLAGEWAGGLPEGLMAVIIDTSLVYTGSQLAYRLFWKPALEARLQRGDVSLAPQRLRH
jgi:hypothetical protein